MSTKPETNARLATMPELLATIIPAYLDPPPPVRRLRRWFRPLPKFKANPTAKRGGGEVFYYVAAVEKFLKARTFHNGRMVFPVKA